MRITKLCTVGCLAAFMLFNVLKLTAQGNRNFDASFRLLPQPQNTTLTGGVGLRFYDLIALRLINTERPNLEAPLSNLPIAATSGKGVITLEVTNAAASDSHEGYILTIKDGAVNIRARHAAGVFYGCQTLLQLLEDARSQRIVIPACIITDKPDIPYRAVHLDMKYHVDNMNYYYRMIDRLARIKVNAVIIEFEDKLRYRQADKVGSGNSVSIDEFAALTRYAKDRFIEISPLVQGLGHVSFILKHDKYQYLRDDRKIDWVIDPLHPDTYELHYKMYDEAMQATPGSKYLHIGGDEVYNLGKSELAKKSGMKPFELQMYWLNKVCKYVTDKGRIPIFWDDMVFSLSGLYGTMRSGQMEDAAWVEKEWTDKQHLLDENIALFPKNCIYMRWNYNFPKIRGNVKAIEWFMKNGLEVWGAPAAQDMAAMLPRDNSIYQPTKDFCEVAVEKRIPGMLQTAWDDSSPHLETYWRGFYDYALLTWNYEDLTHAQAHTIFRHRFYAPELADVKYEFQDDLEQALNFWDTAFMEKGHRRHYPYTVPLIALPEADSTGVWSKRYADRIERSKLELKRYGKTKILIAENIKLSRDNRFALELMNAINELQVYTPQLLLLLYEYDTATKTEKDKHKKQVLALVAKFSEYRNFYENVFSKTRFLSNPPDFILDQNNDPMLANGTNNSDWMYAMEIKMNEALLKWANN
ncbi:MAG: family 20 glycosylhydrolase [Agriterribacter sp.]